MLLIAATVVPTIYIEKMIPVGFTYTQHLARAQQQQINNKVTNSANMTGSSSINTNKTIASSPMAEIPSPSATASQNWTGAIQISPTIGQAIASKVHVSLPNASIIAQKATGNDSRAVLAILETDRGFLVYTIWVVDSNYEFHRVIVDPADGKVLFNQPLTSMELAQSTMMVRAMLHPNVVSTPTPPLATAQPPSGMMIPAPPPSSPPVTGIIPGKP